MLFLQGFLHVMVLLIKTNPLLMLRHHVNQLLMVIILSLILILHLFHQTLLLFIFVDIATLKKILSVVMKIKYDVENIGHNQTRIDNILTDTILNMESISSKGHENSNINDENDYCLLLPLHNEDELNNFEDKLLNKSFRLNVVSTILRKILKRQICSFTLILFLSTT